MVLQQKMSDEFGLNMDVSNEENKPEAPKKTSSKKQKEDDEQL